MIDKIKQIINDLNKYEAERLIKEGFTNNCFFNKDNSLTDNYKITYLEKNKYFYINFGTSGAFMIEKNTGDIYNIKAYGVIDRHKFLGNINTIDTKFLHIKRWNYLR